MNAVAVVIRAAMAAAIAAPVGIALTSVSAGIAEAQFHSDFGAFGGQQYLSQRQSGGGRSRGGGKSSGGRLHLDNCYSGVSDFCRPRRVIVIPHEPYYPPEYGPEVYYEPEYDPADLPSNRNKPKKPVKQAKPKKEPVKQAKPKPKKPQTDTAGGASQAARRDSVPNEVLVEVSMSVPESEVDALAAAQRIEKLGSTEISLLNTRIYRWRITDGRPADQVVAAISADSRVSGAHLNRVFSLQQNLANAGPPQYAAGKMKLSEVHNLTQGENVLIALIDSGADASHPELKGAIAESFDAVGGENKPHAHGTGMAGAIVGQANLKGVAPKARLLDVRAFSPTGKTDDGTTFDVVKGMDWAARKGAKVFNLSFAGPKDELMSRVIQAAIKKGIVVIAAAGNAGPKSPPLFPGAEPGVIAVTSTNAEDGATPFANRGDYLTVAAPGADILLAAPKRAYTVSSGTSISAAYVSGMAALILSLHPQADPKEIAAVLTGTAKDLGAKGRDKDFGAGLANPVAALEMLEPIPQTVASPGGASPAQLAPLIADQPVR
jgi:subtilisin family serine protease